MRVIISLGMNRVLCWCGAGYGSYGPPPGWGHGARMIVLRQGQDAAEAETWIRLENGARVDQAPDPAYRSGLQTVCEAGAGMVQAPAWEIMGVRMAGRVGRSAGADRFLLLRGSGGASLQMAVGRQVCQSLCPPVSCHSAAAGPCAACSCSLSPS